VRFIGNHSSGKMGFDIANEAASFGAEVVLISGPTHFKIKNSSIKLIRVVSAQEMFDACHLYFNEVDVAIAAAAVADYRPKVLPNRKLKNLMQILL
jgi:phosphopantothenoylcysteine decarboxylase/phosphopantothenate--cysteine ligase